MWNFNQHVCRHQEVLPDRKRVTTRSYLPILPVDTDTGRNYSCVATNLAVPSGKSTTVTLNVHRKPITVSVQSCGKKAFFYVPKFAMFCNVKYLQEAKN